MSFRSVAHLTGGATTAVLKWVRAFAKANYEKPEPGSVVVLKLDEMWRFIHAKKTKYGSGKCLTVIVDDLSTGKAEIAVLKP